MKTGPASRIRAAAFSYRSQVRVAFRLDEKGGTWLSCQEEIPDLTALRANRGRFPGHRDWQALFQGSVIGEAASEGKTDYAFYAEAATQSVVNSDAVPRIGPRSREFCGWLSEPVRRPLVLVLRPACPPPETWTPDNPPATALARLLPSFKEVVAAWTRENRQWLASPESIAVCEQDIEITEAYHATGRDAWLYGVELRRTSELFSFAEDYDSMFSMHWFFEEGGRSPLYLGSQMKFLDYGDFDCDGMIDAVFYVSCYNRDGYMLFWREFTKSARFEWGYH